MNAVEFTLTGIMYLLGTSSSATPGKVQVIVPTIAESFAPFGQTIPNHYSYIKVRIKDIDTADFDADTASRPPDFFYRETFTPTTDFPEYAVFGLAGDEVKIEGTGLTPNVLELCRADCKNKFDGSPKDSYDQLPHRGAICPTCNSLNPVYQTSVDPRLVSARLLIEHGKLASASVDPVESSFEPMRLKTDPPNVGKYPRLKVADQAVLEVAATSGSVTLTLKPFPASPKGALTLKLKDGARVEIGHLMADDVLPFFMPHSVEAVDAHFGVYYTMLSQPLLLEPDKHFAVSDPPLPHRVSYHPARVGGPRQNCPPMVDE